MPGRGAARRLVVVLLMLAAPAGHAQRVEWTTSVDASPSLTAARRPLATDAAGNVFVLGSSNDGMVFSIVTVKLAPDGHEAWRATITSTTPATAHAIATDPFGNVYVAASVVHIDGPGRSGANYLIVKFDPSGTELWRRSTNANPLLFASPSAITTDPTGSVYVTGGSNGDVRASGDFFTLKYAPDGTELWRAVTDGGSNLGDVANAIALDDAGNVYVVGASVYRYDLFEGSDVAGKLVKYDATGTLRWRRGIDGGGGLGNGVDVAADAAGNVFMTATSTTGFFNLFKVPYLQLGKFDALGNRLWSRDATGPAGIYGEGSRAHALAVDSLGNAYVTGEYWQALGINTRTTFITLKYSPGGAEQWRAIDSANLSPYGNLGNFAQGLVVYANDKVVVTGQRAFNGPGSTMRLAAGGTVGWSFAQPTFTPAAIARGPANSVYVAGATATGIVVQKIVDPTLSAPLPVEVPATGRVALVMLVLMILVLVARRRALPSATTRRKVE